MFRNENEKLKEEIEKLNLELSKVRNENYEIREENEDIEKINKELLKENKKFYKLDDEIEFLKEQVEKYKEQSLDDLKLLNDEKRKNINNDAELESSKMRISILEQQLKDINKVLEEYRQMPDVKNMIDNLSSLTVPSLDKLTEIISKTNFSEVLEFSKKLEQMTEDVAEIKNMFAYSGRDRM